MTETDSPEMPAGPLILVVEDEPGLRSALARLLTAAGWRVGLAENGQAALRRLEDGLRPQAILVDQNMPVMGGVAFLKLLRREPLFGSIPVVAMSANGWPGCDVPLLEKPFEPIELQRVLATMGVHPSS